MALREMSSALGQLIRRDVRPTTISRLCRRFASGEAAAAKEIPEDFQDLESQSSITSTELPAEIIKTFDPVKRSRERRRELPPSRYAGNGYLGKKRS